MEMAFNSVSSNSFEGKNETSKLFLITLYKYYFFLHEFQIELAFSGHAVVFKEASQNCLAKQIIFLFTSTGTVHVPVIG